jgi:hypothetical protein
MNKDNAHLYLPLVQALAEGKEIQIRIGDEWQDREDVNFGVNPNAYRIKPAPFPPKPESFEWHNPDGLTPEQVGEGYRLCVKEEVKPLFDSDCQFIVGAQSRNKEGEWFHVKKPFAADWGAYLNSGATMRVPLSTPYPDGSRVVDGKLVKPWKLTREIPGFRPLRDGEEWHREDWTEEMLPEGWRPLLKGERAQPDDEYLTGDVWRWSGGGSSIGLKARYRTRRSLPEPANWTIGQRVQTDAKFGSVIEYDPFSRCVKIQWDSTSSWELEKNVTRIP